MNGRYNMNIKKFKIKGNEEILINVEKITSVLPTCESKNEVLLYFGEDCVRVNGTMEEVFEILSEVPTDVALKPITEDVKVTDSFIRYNYEDPSEGIEEYSSIQELFNETTYFYHNTFADEEDYEPDKEYNTIVDCIDLWEGNGYGIARVLKGRY
jgi:hypothetical protein